MGGARKEDFIRMDSLWRSWLTMGPAQLGSFPADRYESPLFQTFPLKKYPIRPPEFDS